MSPHERIDILKDKSKLSASSETVPVHAIIAANGRSGACRASNLVAVAQSNHDTSREPGGCESCVDINFQWHMYLSKHFNASMSAEASHFHVNNSLRQGLPR